MIQIKHRYTETVLCEFEVGTVKEAVVKAVSESDSLCGADLCGANLRRSSLRGADLRGADLRRSSLRGADLRGADLCGADLRRSCLCCDSLFGANLYGANLRGADLEGEKIAIPPVLIGGLNWIVTISESFMRIGCQRHTHEAWSEFGDGDISEMSDDATWFWNENKDWLLAACKAHKAKSMQYREDHPEAEQQAE